LVQAQQQLVASVETPAIIQFLQQLLVTAAAAAVINKLQPAVVLAVAAVKLPASYLEELAPQIKAIPVVMVMIQEVAMRVRVVAVQVGQGLIHQLALLVPEVLDLPHPLPVPL
jgi:hypothetical protein